VISAVLIGRRDLVAPWVLALYAALCIVAAWGWIRFWFGPALRQRVAGLGLALLIGYAGAQAVAAERYKREVRATAHRRFGPSAQWAALPELGHPFTWEPVYASRDTVASDDWRTPRHLDDPLVQRALQTPEGRAMTIFARFLAASVDSSGTVVLRDARYARAWNDGWAMLRVRMD